LRSPPDQVVRSFGSEGCNRKQCAFEDKTMSTLRSLFLTILWLTVPVLAQSDGPPGYGPPGYGRPGYGPDYTAQSEENPAQLQAASVTISGAIVKSGVLGPFRCWIRRRPVAVPVGCQSPEFRLCRVSRQAALRPSRVRGDDAKTWLLLRQNGPCAHAPSSCRWCFAAPMSTARCARSAPSATMSYSP
jgi:hypothetical protein